MADEALTVGIDIGPAVIESEFTTVLIPTKVSAEVDAYDNVVLKL